MALIVIANLKIRAGKRTQFEDFERQALEIIRRHGGELLHTVHPIATLPPTDLPDEVHILRFPHQSALDAYRTDPDLLSLAGLRSEAIASTGILIGSS